MVSAIVFSEMLSLKLFPQFSSNLNATHDFYDM